jgi:hypothetical protein
MELKLLFSREIETGHNLPSRSDDALPDEIRTTNQKENDNDKRVFSFKNDDFDTFGRHTCFECNVRGLNGHIARSS